MKRSERLLLLRERVEDCRRCRLSKTRQNLVFGEGNARAQVMVIGEAPGATEDATGRPFVGRAGKLLDSLLFDCLGLSRKQVYICNVIKCRPPDNRLPMCDEVIACEGFLSKQMYIIKPKLIITLGRTASEAVIGKAYERGKMRKLRITSDLYVDALPTYHPAYLLRDPSKRALVEKDLSTAASWLCKLDAIERTNAANERRA